MVKIGTTVLDRGRRLLARQEIRYLLAGGWNTAFGLLLWYLLLWLFYPAVHYTVIQVVYTVLAVTMAFAAYKWFVFRTRGNLLREYVKVWGVYGVASLLGLAAFPVCVEVLKIPVFAVPVLITAVTVLVSFFGHKHFSFK